MSKNKILIPSAPQIFPPFTSVACEQLHGQLFQDVFKLIIEHGLFPTTEISHEELDVTIRSEGVDNTTILKLLKHIISHIPSSQMSLDPYGIAADFVASALSTTVLNYFLAPVFTLMEFELLKKLRCLTGYPDGDGLICPNFDFSSFMVLRLALHKKYPILKQKGWKEFQHERKNICVFLSEFANDSFERAAIAIGIGSNAIIKVKADSFGRMDINKLQEIYKITLANGLEPLLVIATLGNQIIDPIDKLADFCSDKSLWLHVDGNYGGSYIFSSRNREKLNGIEKSDSFTLNFMTMLGSPDNSIVTITRHKGLCVHTFEVGEYLFKNIGLYDPKCNNGDATIQISRRPDILKMWYIWKIKGTKGIGNHVEQLHQSSLHKLQESFFEKVFSLITKEGLYFQNKRSEPCLQFRTPEQLLKEFDFNLQEEGFSEDVNEQVKILEKVIFYSVHQSHPFYFPLLMASGLDPYSLMGDFVATITKPCKINSPVCQLYQSMSEEILCVIRSKVGWPEENGDGIFLPGGALACILAMQLAIIYKKEEYLTKGICKDKNFIIFMSKSAHSCFKKGAILLGIGLDNVIKVDDRNGKMKASALKEAIVKSLENGDIPFMVVSTQGTTTLGTYDPLEEIVEICKEFNLWLHSDASLGGGLLLSHEKKEKYLKGLEYVDSFNVNMHKMFATVQGSAILLLHPKHKGLLQKVSGAKNQIGQLHDILNVWLMFKSKGISEIGRHVDYIYSLKDYVVHELKKRSDKFRIWTNDFESPGVIFQYLPKSLRQVDTIDSLELEEKLGKVANKLLVSLAKIGIVIGSYSVQNNDGLSTMANKLVLMSSSVATQDINYILDTIDKHGEDLNF